MSTKFFTLLTEIGAAKLASAAALGVPLKITRMAVGDGGGTLPTPSAQQTRLVAEKRRADLNMLYIDPQNSSQMIAEQVIPETEGGWWIREVGLFDETGALIAVGNCPESYKPQLAEGSGRTQTVRMVLITNSTDNVTLKIDPAVVLATRKYVDDKVLELKVYVDDQMAKHIAAADPHTQYAMKASPTFTGTPKAPTPGAGNNTTQLATTAFVQAALVALINGAPGTLDTLKEIAAAINNDPSFSATITNALALKAPLASPSLTGTPTAPTAAQAVNNTQIATTAFVKSALAALVASSPAALDTLNELAAALGNDPNFATTMTNALAGKQPLDNTLTALSGKSVSALLSYLGLNEAAKLDIQESAYDATAGKVLQTGAFGLGATAAPGSSDANALNANGFYRLDSGGLNIPVARAATELLHCQYDANSAHQIAWRAGINAGPMYHRCKANNVWGTWVPFYDAKNKPSAEEVGALPADGTAGAAKKLSTARKIGGVLFDGTADINLPGVDASGNQDTTGNAATATRLKTARRIAGIQFDGSADVEIPANSATKGTRGWWKCGDTGVIYQWGFESVEGATTKAFSFPVAFPTGCASLVVSNNIERTSGENSMTGYIKSSSQFSLSNTAATGRAISWFAIGF